MTSNQPITHHGYLQVSINNQLRKVFAVVNMGKMTCFSDDPSKSPIIAQNPVIVFDLSLCKLSESVVNRRPKNFSISDARGNLIDFTCPTNSIKNQWIQSIHSCSTRAGLSNGGHIEMLTNPSFSQQQGEGKGTSAYDRLNQLSQSLNQLQSTPTVNPRQQQSSRHVRELILPARVSALDRLGHRIAQMSHPPPQSHHEDPREYYPSSVPAYGMPSPLSQTAVHVQTAVRVPSQAPSRVLSPQRAVGASRHPTHSGSSPRANPRPTPADARPLQYPNLAPATATRQFSADASEYYPEEYGAIQEYPRSQEHPRKASRVVQPSTTRTRRDSPIRGVTVEEFGSARSLKTVDHLTVSELRAVLQSFPVEVRSALLLPSTSVEEPVEQLAETDMETELQQSREFTLARTPSPTATAARRNKQGLGRAQSAADRSSRMPRWNTSQRVAAGRQERSHRAHSATSLRTREGQRAHTGTRPDERGRASRKEEGGSRATEYRDLDSLDYLEGRESADRRRSVSNMSRSSRSVDSRRYPHQEMISRSSAQHSVSEYSSRASGWPARSRRRSSRSGSRSRSKGSDLSGERTASSSEEWESGRKQRTEQVNRFRRGAREERSGASRDRKKSQSYAKGARQSERRDRRSDSREEGRVLERRHQKQTSSSRRSSSVRTGIKQQVRRDERGSSAPARRGSRSRVSAELTPLSPSTSAIELKYRAFNSSVERDLNSSLERQRRHLAQAAEPKKGSSRREWKASAKDSPPPAARHSDRDLRADISTKARSESKRIGSGKVRSPLKHSVEQPESFFRFMDKRRTPHSTVKGEPSVDPRAECPSSSPEKQPQRRDQARRQDMAPLQREASVDTVTDLAEWQRLTHWLERIGMSHYVEALRTHGITKLSLVELLREKDMGQIGIALEDVPLLSRQIAEFSRRTRSISEQALSPTPRIIAGRKPLQLASAAPSSSVKPSTLSPDSIGAQPVDTNTSSSNSAEAGTLDPAELCLCLLASFDSGDTDGFFRLWASAAPLFPSDRSAMQSTKQALEFHLHLYFLVFALQHEGDDYEQVLRSKRHLKQYLEGVMEAVQREGVPRSPSPEMRGEEATRQLDTDKEREVMSPAESQQLTAPTSPTLDSSFTRSREYATFAGIVLVPDPRLNAAYSELFRPEWMVGVRARLEEVLRVRYCFPLDPNAFEEASPVGAVTSVAATQPSIDEVSGDSKQRYEQEAANKEEEEEEEEEEGVEVEGVEELQQVEALETEEMEEKKEVEKEKKVLLGKNQKSVPPYQPPTVETSPSPVPPQQSMDHLASPANGHLIMVSPSSPASSISQLTEDSPPIINQAYDPERYLHGSLGPSQKKQNTQKNLMGPAPTRPSGTQQSQSAMNAQVAAYKKALKKQQKTPGASAQPNPAPDGTFNMGVGLKRKPLVLQPSKVPALPKGGRAVPVDMHSQVKLYNKLLQRNPSLGGPPANPPAAATEGPEGEQEVSSFSNSQNKDFHTVSTAAARSKLGARTGEQAEKMSEVALSAEAAKALVADPGLLVETRASRFPSGVKLSGRSGAAAAREEIM